MHHLVWLSLAVVACTEAPVTSEDADDNGVVGECAVEEGSCAPDFALPDATGMDVALSDLRGSRVIVAGSAMWCSTCRSFLQDLDAWAQTSPDDVVSLTVVIEDNDRDPMTVDQAAVFQDGLDLSIPVLADVDGEWEDEWGGTRHSYTVIDSDGTVVLHMTGSSGADLDALTEAALSAQ